MNFTKSSLLKTRGLTGRKGCRHQIARQTSRGGAFVGTWGVTSIRRGCIQQVWCAFLFVTVVLPLIGSDEHPVYPVGFVEAAGVFKSAPATNRYNAAAKLMKMLPTTPVVSTDKPIDYKSRGSRIIVRDHTKPSFILTESEARKLLGSPLSTNSSTYSYLIQQKGTNNLQAFLLIEFYNDHAVFSSIY